MEDLRKQIIKCLETNCLAEAIELLKGTVDDLDFEASRIGISRQYYRLQQAELQQIRPANELNQEYNRLTSSILQLMDRYLLAESKTGENKADLQTIYLLAQKRVRIVSYLLADKNDTDYVTLGHIHEATGGGRRKFTNDVLNELLAATWASKSKIGEKSIWTITEEGRKMLHQLKVY